MNITEATATHQLLHWLMTGDPGPSLRAAAVDAAGVLADRARLALTCGPTADTVRAGFPVAVQHAVVGAMDDGGVSGA